MPGKPSIEFGCGDGSNALPTMILREDGRIVLVFPFRSARDRDIAAHTTVRVLQKLGIFKR